ncbi:MAG: tRNA-dihydrouridine synthase family protein [Candidatus Thermoplasmatota archaeon]
MKRVLGITQPLVLSPMVDVTDPAFRALAKANGADITCSEMIAAIGLAHGNRSAWELVARGPAESPYGVQFMSADPATLADAVRQLAERVKVDYVDVNLGCPAPNILKSCAGGFLMRDPKQAGRVVAAARKAADEAGIPHVSAKMRLGPDATRLTYLEVASEVAAAGADWVTLHARTVAQGYSGDADWSHIARLVEGVEIPVLGNGDLRTPDDVVRMREATGCAGFFIARAAMRDPTIFRRMRQALDGKTVDAEPTLPERMGTLLDYVERAGPTVTVPELRRVAVRMVTGEPGAARLRAKFNGAADAATLRDLAAATRSSGA